MTGNELLDGGSRVILLPFPLATRRVVYIFHYTVGDDDIRVWSHQLAEYFQLSDDVLARVAGIQHDENRISWPKLSRNRLGGFG